MSNNETKISKDASGNKLIVTKDFNAPLEKVWRAWTESDLLDQWWAPKPWKAETKSLSFTAGGSWRYAMVSPQGEKHWCRVDIKEVVPQKSFKSTALFTDAEGTPTDTAPVMNWHTVFTENGDITSIHVALTFDKPDDLEKIVAMGFKEGFSMGLGNLDELFAAS
ncbi:SRPBCC family protein [Mucilaginibacter sp. KACC 22063]|uniref:SRPBCC family protein n=1 Tax=Mucilaginibacter sp. KACC 22063 TaxID=3025666 RepID=UPI0023660FF3|nr:SRPBCC domain-containing protein [Mucilaginibacter sp. KACC 22063]WDF54275.1 SRPBCC domain-containing protein [Mucilaginibacter sp. KACC 22063]